MIFFRGFVDISLLKANINAPVTAWPHFLLPTESLVLIHCKNARSLSVYWEWVYLRLLVAKIALQSIILSVNVDCKNLQWYNCQSHHKNAQWLGTILNHIVKDDVHIRRKSPSWSEMIGNDHWSRRENRNKFYLPDEVEDGVRPPWSL